MTSANPISTRNYSLHAIAAAYALSGPPAMYCFGRMMVASGGQWNNALYVPQAGECGRIEDLVTVKN